MQGVAIEQTLLIAQLALPALAFLSRSYFFPKLNLAVFFLLCCVVEYGVLLLRVHMIDIRLEQELNAFDLNGDAYFSGAELTPAQAEAQAEALDAWSNDTGRALAPYTGLIISPAVVAIAFAVTSIAKRIVAFTTQHFARRT